jgi:hypothetical protein
MRITKLINSIIGFFRKLFRKKPSKIKRFNVELIDMSNVRLTWSLPTVSARQAEIQHVEISLRVNESFPWTLQDIIATASVQELLLVDVAPGTYFYQGVVVDIEGNRGNPVETFVNIGVESPGEISNFTATLE